MLISYNHKFIFVHNPKAGGTSIKESLKEFGLECPLLRFHKLNASLEKFKLFRDLTRLLGRKNHLGKNLQFLKHDNSLEIRKKLPDEIWNNFFKFGFVRNPWSWQVSLYNFILQNKNHFQHKLIKSIGGFEKYIEWRVNEDKHLQKEFFYDEYGNCLVDFIGKLENIESDFNKICKKIGIKARLLYENKTEHKPYQEYYDDYTRNLIAEHFKDDIELFNYRF